MLSVKMSQSKLQSVLVVMEEQPVQQRGSLMGFNSFWTTVEDL